MENLELYKIDLKTLALGVHEYEYVLGEEYFKEVEGDQVQQGNVKVYLTVKKTSMMSELNFQIAGTVMVSCDRCLDDMELPIETESRLIVKFGEEYSEENEELIIIPEEEGKIDLTWFLYEFIVLAIPMKHVHAPGECNQAMASKLRQHVTRQIEDNDDEYDDDDFIEDDSDEVDEANDTIDPRWAALKKLVENNNN